MRFEHGVIAAVALVVSVAPVRAEEGTRGAYAEVLADLTPARVLRAATLMAERGRLAPAAQMLERSMGRADAAGLGGDFRYTLGQMYFRQAQLLGGVDPKAAMDALNASEAWFRGAVQADTDDEDAARNVEVALRLIERRRDQQERQQQSDQDQNPRQDSENESESPSDQASPQDEGDRQNEQDQDQEGGEQEQDPRSPSDQQQHEQGQGEDQQQQDQQQQEQQGPENGGAEGPDQRPEPSPGDEREDDGSSSPQDIRQSDLRDALPPRSVDPAAWDRTAAEIVDHERRLRAWLAEQLRERARRHTRVEKDW